MVAKLSYAKVYILKRIGLPLQPFPKASEKSDGRISMDVAFSFDAEVELSMGSQNSPWQPLKLQLEAFQTGEMTGRDASEYGLMGLLVP